MSSRRNPLSTAALIILIKAFSTLSLTCHPAEYQNGNQCCPKCPAGSRVKSHCGEFISTSCQPCMDGTFTDQPNGLDQCSPCASCDSGSGLKVKRSCTRTSDTVCEALQGFYCISPAGDGCDLAQKHSSCEPGQYIRRNGTPSTDTECSDCSAGTFSDGTSPSCQPHKQCEALNLRLITAGTSAADAQCGEHSGGVTVAVIVTVAVVLIVAAAALIYFRKKKNLSKLRHKHRGSSTIFSEPECQTDEPDESAGRKQQDEESEKIKGPTCSECDACRKRTAPTLC